MTRPLKIADAPRRLCARLNCRREFRAKPSNKQFCGEPCRNAAAQSARRACRKAELKYARQDAAMQPKEATR